MSQKYQNKRKFLKGFTLIEILLSVSLLAMLFAIPSVIYQSSLDSNQVYGTKSLITSAINIAQNNSISGKSDSTWGVYITTTNITVFKGTSYATRDMSLGGDFNTIYTYPNTMSVSGITELVFAKKSGQPNTTGSITINKGSTTTSLSINTKGIYAY
jgi:prepilin-type N-terminal cleavage/methylation domain-containing protein